MEHNTNAKPAPVIVSADHGIRPGEKDSAFMREASANRLARVVPMVGDALRYPDGRERRIADVWRGEKSQTLQPCDGGSFHLYRNGVASFSGGLDSSIPLARLRDSGETVLASFWIFHNDFMRAHAAVYLRVPVRVWLVAEA